MYAHNLYVWYSFRVLNHLQLRIIIIHTLLYIYPYEQCILYAYNTYKVRYMDLHQNRHCAQHCVRLQLSSRRLAGGEKEALCRRGGVFKEMHTRIVRRDFNEIIIIFLRPRLHRKPIGMQRVLRMCISIYNYIYLSRV